MVIMRMFVVFLNFVSLSLGQNAATSRFKQDCSSPCPAVKCLSPFKPEGACCPICREQKPGMCPKPKIPGICVLACTSDWNCPGSQKCCSNGCGRVCTKPVGNGKSCFYNGKKYENGETFKVLCNTCTCTEGKVSCTEKACLPKPGHCPRQDPDKAGICILGCIFDWGCQGVKKCCSNGCGMMCMLPLGRYSSKPNCAGVYCPDLYCDDLYTPPGGCCEICPPLKPIY
ncbi:WAP four-disulfide core domain protein 2-like isoform X1 [Mercenaria mercenaria]|uniref:WAP four-disulfide core domain protein 2-like isoform X1 n=1 Tax=Mercenaria mercenaria TaxID=6596 RepID=UPI00234E8A6B|nr:WAP four-disulfide core domain protein 2-like isoform X1 [Mercenaria mercenaria]